MKIYLKALGYTGSGMLGLTLIMTIFHYFNLMGDKVADTLKLLIAIISIIVGGFIVGKASDHKGWLEGLKLSLIIILVLVLLTLIFRLGFSSKSLLYYLIIIGSSMIGSMIGISTKEKKK